MERYHCQNAVMYGGQFTVAEIQTGLQSGAMPPDLYVFHPQHNQWLPAAQFLQAMQMMPVADPNWPADAQPHPPQPNEPMPAPGMAGNYPAASHEAPMEPAGPMGNKHALMPEEEEDGDWFGIKQLKWAAVTIVVAFFAIWGRSASIESQVDQQEKERRAKEAEQADFKKKLNDLGQKTLDDLKRRQRENDPLRMYNGQ